MYNLAVKLGQLAPRDDLEANQPTMGTSVTLNIHGIPGLEHLSAKTDDAVDVPYTEVKPHKEDAK